MLGGEAAAIFMAHGEHVSVALDAERLSDQDKEGRGKDRVSVWVRNDMVIR